jgi:hypothetical protein
LLAGASRGGESVERALDDYRALELGDRRQHRERQVRDGVVLGSHLEPKADPILSPARL